MTTTFDPGKHPRTPAGDPSGQGGKFASKQNAAPDPSVTLAGTEPSADDIEWARKQGLPPHVGKPSVTIEWDEVPTFSFQWPGGPTIACDQRGYGSCWPQAWSDDADDADDPDVVAWVPNREDREYVDAFMVNFSEALNDAITDRAVRNWGLYDTDFTDKIAEIMREDFNVRDRQDTDNPS